MRFLLIQVYGHHSKVSTLDDVGSQKGTHSVKAPVTKHKGDVIKKNNKKNFYHL